MQMFLQLLGNHRDHKATLNWVRALEDRSLPRIAEAVKHDFDISSDLSRVHLIGRTQVHSEL